MAKKPPQVAVRMHTSIAGVGWSARPSQVITLPKSEAEAFVDSGQAEYVKEADVAQRDKAVDAENAKLREANEALQARIEKLEASSSSDETTAVRTGTTGKGK